MRNFHSKDAHASKAIRLLTRTTQTRWNLIFWASDSNELIT